MSLGNRGWGEASFGTKLTEFKSGPHHLVTVDSISGLFPTMDLIILSKGFVHAVCFVLESDTNSTNSAHSRTYGI